MNKMLLAILKVIGRHEESVIGSREIARQLKRQGVSLSERTVRYHMKLLDERGFTEVFGKEGRKITEKGKQELQKALVSEKVGFVISRIDTLSYLTDFDLEKMEGKVILNVSYIPEGRFQDALRKMKPVFYSPYTMSDRVAVAKGGQTLGEAFVPEGSIALGTICSVTINGIFLKCGIPVLSRFGGVLEVEDGVPRRFVSLISYEGSSLDPLEIFIRSGMTDVDGAVSMGEGKVLASFREIPMVSLDKALRVVRELEARGIRGVIKIGEPNNALFEIPVGMDRAGVAITGGLNPLAILEEMDIQVQSKAMSTLYEYSRLLPLKSLL
ncbi:MAG: NrpR regulatory domain-containing protein [Nitrospiraceae bacterium]|nr:NrpR regulatory domain-containing protein [Nitrospiraceae bacterium]